MTLEELRERCAMVAEGHVEALMEGVAAAKKNKSRQVARDYESMAIEAAHIAHAIRALPLPDVATPAPDEGVTQADREAVQELISMLEAVDMQEGAHVFDHTPEEFGLHVMENSGAILSALKSGDADALTAANARIAELEGAIERARGNISGGLCYMTAEAKHAQLKDADKTLETVLRAKGGAA